MAPKKKKQKKQGNVAEILRREPTAQTKKRKPIGVPEGYVVTRRKPLTEIELRALRAQGIRPKPGEEYFTEQVAPRYFVGDEWLPAQLSAENRAGLQVALTRAGFLNPDKAMLGVWDDPSRSAFTNLLEIANSTGADWQASLRELSSVTVSGKRVGGTRGGAGGGGGRVRAPLTIRLTSPEDLKDMFTAVAVKRLGRRASEEELSRMVSAYHGIEREFQTQAYRAVETGGALTEPPTAEAFGEKKIVEERPQEAAEFQFLKMMQVIDQMISGR